MNFKTWLESTVSIKDIGEAIQKTLEFQIPGKWTFEIAPHHWNKKNDAIRVTANLRNEKTLKPSNRFLISSYAILENPIETYDSIDGNSDMRIISSMHYIDRPGYVTKLSERSENILGPSPWKKNWGPHDGKSLRTPYELSKWVSNVINDFGNDDNDGGDDAPEETPPDNVPVSNPQLVGSY